MGKMYVMEKRRVKVVIYLARALVIHKKRRVKVMI
jgi:hypothetical protein